MQKKLNRIGEIDFLRGIAILLMIYFHLIYDLNEFYNVSIDYQQGVNYVLGKIAAILFILITGVSSALSGNNVKRGLMILLYAYVITFFSYLFAPEAPINFGILHLLGFSVLLYVFFKDLNPPSLFFLGTGIIILGLVLGNIPVETGLLFPLGLLNPNYRSLDFYPIFPYFGFFIYGIALKKTLYHQNQSLLPFSLIHHPISTLGRKSLLIYLIHQPILFILLYLFYLIS